MTLELVKNWNCMKMLTVHILKTVNGSLKLFEVQLILVRISINPNDSFESVHQKDSYTDLFLFF